MKQFDMQEIVLGRSRRLRTSLAAVAGLKLEDGYRGTFEHDGVTLKVCIEGAQRISLRVPCPASPDASAAVVATSGLAGNLRFVHAGASVELVADTMLDGIDHLPGTLAEIADSVKHVHAGCAPFADKEPRVSAARVDEAIEGLGWPEEAIVRKSDSWELRPRIQLHRGVAPQPVQLTRSGSGLSIHRTLIPSRAAACDTAQAEQSARALAELALDLNGQIRFARLAQRGEAFVVEAVLRAELVTAFWLGETVRAVATASARCQALVTLVTSDQRVAEVFLATSNPETLFATRSQS